MFWQENIRKVNKIETFVLLCELLPYYALSFRGAGALPYVQMTILTLHISTILLAIFVCLVLI